MAVRQRRYPKEEFAQRGNAIYERDIRPQVEADNQGKYVAIDIETGEWEMDASETAAGDRLRQRIPDAQTWATNRLPLYQRLRRGPRSEKRVITGSEWVSHSHRRRGRRPGANQTNVMRAACEFRSVD